ncbi:MAG: hypothetical protein WC708_14550 [Lentisphaeria bacterium]
MKIAHAFTAAALPALLCGCGTTAKFVYPANYSTLVQVAASPVTEKKVAVPPFDDQRGDDNQFGTLLLYLIPLMPFGWVDYERPDAARGFLTVQTFDFTPSEDLPKAAAYSLRRSGLFADAFFTFGGEKDKADFILEGQILSSRYTGSMWTYGLSLLGPNLWFVGFPAGRSHNYLVIALQFKDAKTRKIIWEKSYDLEYSVTQGLYYSWGHDVRGYAYLMQQVMNDAVTGISSAVRATGSPAVP